ncbi:hypothetical protein [Amycolatopsis sp. 195334CR]|nr:hypothetical protein [Amycolatopsis sp. 195334CR]MBN6040959.1 hypothetical protein [Amycolatopsis sp. 195334CR]
MTVPTESPEATPMRRSTADTLTLRAVLLAALCGSLVVAAYTVFSRL